MEGFTRVAVFTGVYAATFSTSGLVGVMDRVDGKGGVKL